MPVPRLLRKRTSSTGSLSESSNDGVMSDRDVKKREPKVDILKLIDPGPITVPSQTKTPSSYPTRVKEFKPDRVPSLNKPLNKAESYSIGIV